MSTKAVILILGSSARPKLRVTFQCLRKRGTENVPCFLKDPFLTSGNGSSTCLPDVTQVSRKGGGRDHAKPRNTLAWRGKLFSCGLIWRAPILVESIVAHRAICQRMHRARCDTLRENRNAAQSHPAWGAHLSSEGWPPYLPTPPLRISGALSHMAIY